MSPVAAPSKPKLVGKIVHYYDKIGVGVIELAGPLKVGDTITVMHGNYLFSQEVESMQMDHEDVTTAKKGQSIGLKLNEKVSEGAMVMKD